MHPSLASGLKNLGVGLGFLLVGVAILLALIVCPFVAFLSSDGDLCGNSPLSEVVSPSGRLKAVVFERDCGATTHFSTHVAIIGVGESLKDAKSFFVVDADPGRASSSEGGGLEVRVHWWGDNRLEIEHEPFARIVRAESTFEGITIAYGAVQ